MKKNTVLCICVAAALLVAVSVSAQTMSDYEGYWGGRWYKTTCNRSDGLDAYLDVDGKGLAYYTYPLGSKEWKVAPKSDSAPHHCFINKDKQLVVEAGGGRVFTFRMMKKGDETEDGKTVQGPTLEGRIQEGGSANAYIYMRRVLK